MYILGFEGRTCEVNIDDCHNHQCKNGGTCLDGIKTYTCQCPPTYTGMYCQTDVDECQQRPNICKVWIPCFFKVMLIDIYTFFMPWLNVFFCFFLQNGATCTNTPGSFSCICVNGWTGEDCSENIDDCTSAACFNGATCIDRVGSFLCQCPPGKVKIFHIFLRPFM